MSFASNTESHAWWAALRHEGLLLDESRLRQLFPNSPEWLNSWQAGHLRKALVSFQATPEDTATRTALITCLLEDTIGLSEKCGGTWQRGSAVPADLSRRSVTGENLKPSHLWTHPGSTPLPVFTSPDARLGVGKGKRSAARVIEWMRATQHRLALLTNGHQWRLIYAHGDSSAWCESDSTQWFIEGQPAGQFDALRLLLDPRALTAATPDPEKPASPLLTAIEASRRGQSELSAVLGERVRIAVEKLIASHGPAFLAMDDAPARQDIYVAACRCILRMVFTLFAEARDLLPRSNPVYWQSYSLGGLLEQLLRVGAGSGRERLRHRFSAWPRLVALGRLVHAGSPHEALPLLPYGGELFAPGNAVSTDGISRALAVFESACFDSDHQIMPDSEVLEILTLLTRTQMAIRQGRGKTTVTVPVDFSDLSSEYIGILYEGLLDYELRCVSEDEGAVVFLALGNEPALPLSRLEPLDDDDLKDLIKAFKKSNKAPAGEEAGEEETEDEPDEETEDPSDEADPSDDDEATDESGETEEDPETAQSTREEARRRALAWAAKAVDVGGMISKLKGRASAEAVAARTAKIEAVARGFIRRLILPGEWYLVRWGGTRKGSGSFYTRPGLASPTIRRTLEPLAYERNTRGQLIPRSPEKILALKTCDPACGSGTFPVGAVRYLTEALFQSVFHHHWLEFATVPQADGTTREIIKLGVAATESPEGTIPPVLDALIKEVRLGAVADESRLRAWLKRAVVESCIYGVDLDPLAIELARLSLWVETMDPTLPFTFLDHKLRCGNGLVGAWMDQFQHYPVMAWHREGGDKNHTNFHHHFREKTGKKGGTQVGDVWTESIKTHLDNVIRPALRSYIEENTDLVFTLITGLYEPDHLLDQAIDAFSAIHADVDDPAAQRSAFETWLASPAYLNLRSSLDLWCALWFWPADRLAAAPTPQNFGQPSTESLAIVEELHRTHRFFHWELEFPDVFGSGTREKPGGFHAILGNPPWETIQPMSKEWFANIDPLYPTYGKQVALARQSELFTNDIAVEQGWLRYIAHIKATSHFGKYAAFSFGDPNDNENKAYHLSFGSAKQNELLHARWRPKRKSIASFADPAHPFRHQGEGKPYLQKLFMEQAYSLLRLGGRLGFIVPSGIYSDQGSATLRSLFLDHCRWEWCFSFENREGIFDIHRSFKFIALILEKGGKTIAIHTAFMRRALADWDSGAESIALEYPRELVTKLSPLSAALVEICDSRDIAILDRMYSNGVLLGDSSERGWGLHYQQGDFNMTSASKLFPPLPKWEAQGYRPDEYSHWLKGDWRPVTEYGLPPGFDSEPAYFRAASILQRPGILLSRDGAFAIRIEDIRGVAVPLYEGRMIGQFDFSQKGWVSGKGRTAIWRDISREEKEIEPQYLISVKNAQLSSAFGRPRIAFIGIASSTNSRTMVSSIIGRFPATHVTPIFTEIPAKDNDRLLLAAAAILNSFCFDFQLRQRLGSGVAYLSPSYLVERSFVNLSAMTEISHCSSRLSLGHIGFARLWKDQPNQPRPWHQLWAITQSEQLRLRCVVDSLTAWAMGLEQSQLSWLLRDCDHPRADSNSNSFTSRLDPKGFWRVDKDKHPELRHTVLAQVAYADLCAQGLDAFLAGPDGDGWQLPETLRLADYGLGHDDRAKQPQPVASRLGPRFLDWQLAKDPAESWAECEAHAAQLDALWTHARQLAGVPEADADSASPAESTPAQPRGLKGKSDANQPELF
ncbi:MAG: hypothetical protein V4584_05800 [Verrucomicrobiota bacterium]